MNCDNNSVKIAGAAFNRKFLRSFTLKKWLEYGEKRFFRTYTPEQRIELLTTAWNLAKNLR